MEMKGEGCIATLRFTESLKYTSPDSVPEREFSIYRTEVATVVVSKRSLCCESSILTHNNQYGSQGILEMCLVVNVLNKAMFNKLIYISAHTKRECAEKRANLVDDFFC